MKSPARSPAASPRGRPYDRHSGTGLRGLPKKNGAGRKGTWGDLMDQAPVAVLDKNDPNYDSDEDQVFEFPFASQEGGPAPAPIVLNEPKPAPVSPTPASPAGAVKVPAVNGQESAASSLDEKSI